MVFVEQFFNRLSVGKALKVLSLFFFVPGVAFLLKGTVAPEFFPSGILAVLIAITLFGCGEIIVTLKAILHRLDNKL